MDTQDTYQGSNIENVAGRLIEIYKRKTLPSAQYYLSTLEKIIPILKNEDQNMRPYSDSGLPGGLVCLKQDIPTVIIPDIHARIDFLLSVLLFRDDEAISILEKLSRDMIQIVCVGDGFHAEGRAVERWRCAYDEYLNDYKKHKCIDEEMRESLGVMEIVMEVKSEFPENFHFLKGNHENISNEYGNGNYSFRKYAYEGEMVKHYVEKFFGDDFINVYSTFEKNLPLLAIGKNFLISHSEPFTFFGRDDLIEYRDRPEVVYGLTWTVNDDAEPESVIRMLKFYLDEEFLQGSYYFGGHRPVAELYHLRADGRYVQIHNPNKFIIAYIRPDREIDLDEDIIEIEDSSSKIKKKKQSL